MKTHEAIQAAVDASGESLRRVSARLGRSPNYLASVVGQSRQKGGGVSSGTLASVAGACGFVLAMVPEDAQLPEGSIPVDAPEQRQS